VSATLLAEHIRSAAHDRHRCGWCHEPIEVGEQYRDQRIADSGTVYTWREHIRCSDRLWHWWNRSAYYADEMKSFDPHELFLMMLSEES